MLESIKLHRKRHKLEKARLSIKLVQNSWALIFAGAKIIFGTDKTTYLLEDSQERIKAK
jgi:hypothetical protein